MPEEGGTTGAGHRFEMDPMRPIASLDLAGSFTGCAMPVLYGAVKVVM
jgi:hypothetical protein